VADLITLTGDPGAGRHDRRFRRRRPRREGHRRRRLPRRRGARRGGGSDCHGLPARPVHGLSERAGRGAGLRRRDLLRPAAVHRLVALGRSALVPALRQVPAHDGHRDPGRAQAAAGSSCSPIRRRQAARRTTCASGCPPTPRSPSPRASSAPARNSWVISASCCCSTRSPTRRPHTSGCSATPWPVTERSSPARGRRGRLGGGRSRPHQPPPGTRLRAGHLGARPGRRAHRAARPLAQPPVAGNCRPHGPTWCRVRRWRFSATRGRAAPASAAGDRAPRAGRRLTTPRSTGRRRFP
jgi:hypothetical protein